MKKPDQFTKLAILATFIRPISVKFVARCFTGQYEQLRGLVIEEQERCKREHQSADRGGWGCVASRNES